MLRILVLFGVIDLASGTIYQGLNKVYSGYEVASFYDNIYLPSVTKCTMECDMSTTCVTSTFDALTKQCQLSVDTMMSAIKTGNSNKKTTTAIQNIPVCLTPPEVFHGKLSVVSVTTFGAVAELACDQDYYIAPSSPTSVNCVVTTGWGDIYMACIDTLVSPSGYFGTSFVTAFMMNSNLNFGVPSIHIACAGTATVRVEIPYLAVDEFHYVTNTLDLVYSNDITHITSGATEQKAIFVTSDIPIMLYSANLNIDSADGSLMLPRQVLQNEYFIAGHASTVYGLDQFLLIGLSDHTTVTIDYPTNPVDTILLHENQTYLKQAVGLSGTRIRASRPMFVLSGHICANIPNNAVTFCDYIDEIAPPVNSLGTKHIVSFMSPRSDFTISVVATLNLTSLTIYDDSGSVLEIIFDLTAKSTIFRTFTDFRTISLVSNKPVMVHQYGHGSNSVYGDPSMMFIPDVGFYGEKYEFVIPPGFTLPCALAVVISDSFSTSMLKLNNQNVTPTELVTVTVPGVGTYTVMYLDVQAGYNKLAYASGRATFGAWVYGRQESAEFAWTLGFAV